MKYIYAFLFLIAGGPAFASVYATAEAAAEGMSRGKPLDPSKDGFVRGVGFLDIETDHPDVKEGAAITATAVLVSKDTLLTAAHVFKKYHPTSVIAIFYPDIIEYNAHVRTAVEAGKDPTEVLFHGKSILDIAAKLDLATIAFHPDLDLVMVKLKRALPTVPRLPLWLKKPEALVNGFLASYAEVSILGSTEADTPLDRLGKRHISVLDVAEKGIPDGKGGSQVFWTRKWDIPASIDVTNPRNKIFTPSAGDHRLAAYSQPGDSGAPFIMKNGKEYVIAGMYKGKSILFEGPGAHDAVKAGVVSTSFAGAGGADDAVKRTVLSLVTPLYLAAGWIEAHR